MVYVFSVQYDLSVSLRLGLGRSAQNRAAYIFLMLGAPQLRPGSPPVLVYVQPTNYLDTESSTADTVRWMCAGIHRASRDEFFRGAALAVPFRYRGHLAMPAMQFGNLDVDHRQKAACAIADWWFAKHFIKFTPDQEITRKLHGYADALEALIEPAVMIRMLRPEGDCDCFTMFICALLECQRIPWEIVTVACSRKQPGIWSHVFPRAVLGALRLPLDASHGSYPGWSVPSRDIQRMAVWTPRGEILTPPEEVI